MGMGKNMIALNARYPQSRPAEPVRRSAGPPVFADRHAVLSNDAAAALQTQPGARQSFERNDTIFSEGDPVDRIYRIVSGTVRLCRHTQDGKRYIADFLLPGDMLGFIDPNEHLFTAEAVEHVVLVHYPRTQIARLFDSDASVRSNFLVHFSARMMAFQDHLFTLACQNAKERLASFLLRLAGRKATAAGQRLDLSMGRRDIADHLGLSVETICRSIAQLRDAGIVEVPNIHQLILKDIAALRSLSQGTVVN